MPDIPLPSPVAPANHTVSGGTYTDGSGFTQVSGPPLIYAEYRQSLNVYYSRNPAQSMPTAQVPYYSLLQASANEVRNVTSNHLHFTITAWTSCHKITSNFALSSSLQMQKFQLNANKFDKVGYTYGDVSGPNNQYVFGPQGELVTTQPYVRRNLWDDTLDTEYSIHESGTNLYRLESGSNPLNDGTGDTIFGYGAHIGYPYTDYLLDGYNLVSAEAFPRMKMEGGGDPYSMMGGSYNTSSEVAFGDNAAGLTRLITFIETNCANLVNVWANAWYFRFVKTQPQVSNGWNQPQEADRMEPNPYYNTSFHDYT